MVADRVRAWVWVGSLTAVLLLTSSACKFGGQKGGEQKPKPSASASVQKFTPLTWHEIVGPVEGFSTHEEVFAHFGGGLPTEFILRGGRMEQFRNRPEFALAREPVITSDDIVEVEVVDVGYGPTVGFTLSPAAGERFRQYTRDHIGTGLAIVMDGKVISNPVIRGEIGDKGIISGNFTPQEVDDLAARLRTE